MLAAEITCAETAARAAAAAIAAVDDTASSAKQDGTPVTAADLAADGAIQATIAAHFPSDQILSEESADSAARREAERVWIIDPIDGTRAFINGCDEWAIHIALVINAELCLGLVAMPALGRTIIGIPASGTVYDDRNQATPAPLAEPDTLVASRTANRSLEPIRAALPGFSFMRCSSVGVKAAHLLDGRCDSYVHNRPIHEWDAAAPAALLQAAGFHATALDGSALRWNTSDAQCPGLFFSRRDDHADLAARLRAARVEVQAW